jgi:hypothetical protein
LGIDLERFNVSIVSDLVDFGEAFADSESGQIAINISADAFSSEAQLVETLAEEYAHSVQLSGIAITPQTMMLFQPTMEPLQRTMPQQRSKHS